MSTLLTINVTNNEANNQNFFFFQQPAIYVGGATVYSNSLYTAPLGNHAATGGSLTFLVNLQYYAGVQQATQAPVPGQTSGYGSAMQPIDLAPSAGSTLQNNDLTTATLVPLGLSKPVPGSGVEPGAFRITMPVFAPPAIYNVGSAVLANGTPVLSNFVQAQPNTNTDCQPILKFYVATGSYTPGTVMDFTQSSVSAALCDFTGGRTTINVTLNNDGSWTVA
ncbi:hypothetical protein [Methylobacterium platani]|uniref:Uncharacterized protein n=2 Tax=Methylobacterium platani TaxID=427683 RepID=A0A179SLB4_9HYPH|nr:hypothetical protein [Methylobacterium platani]KMO10679.1 hypothetical protein SQ03_29415 [Methylobacterium platani JCM 14648]OAS27274.1 hypothetical protein A5481_02290 [Methylobacterium platani]